MVLPLPKWTIRDVLLVIVIGTWVAVTIHATWMGEPLEVEHWLIPAAICAAIIRVFPGRRPPDDGEGGEG